MTIDTIRPTLEPHTQQFVDGLDGAPPIYRLSPEEARSVLVQVQAIPVGKPGAKIEDIAFPVGPTGLVPVRIVRPAGTVDALPAIIYIHGGGWILGDRSTHDRLVREIAVGAGAVVVFVDYDRSPEARYPVAIEQAYAATCYVVDHSADLRIDPSRLAVAWRQRRREYGGGADPNGKATPRSQDRLSGSVLPGHRRRFRYGFLHPLCGWAVVDQARHAMVLGRLLH